MALPRPQELQAEDQGQAAKALLTPKEWITNEVHGALSRDLGSFRVREAGVLFSLRCDASLRRSFRRRELG